MSSLHARCCRLAHLLFCLAALFPAQASRLRAQATAPPSTASIDSGFGIATIPLWPHGAPNAKGDAPEDTPTLTVLRPAQPTGSAVIVAPGGGYLVLMKTHEGRQPADRLTELGVTVFVLTSRLGPKYVFPVPLDDARRAIRMVRSLAPKYGYSPDRIGMMGFSAGGHLAAIAAVLPEDGKPNDPDPVERQSSKVNFMVLVYPWLNAMQPQVPDPANGNKLMINYCSVTKGLTQADCARLDPQYTPVAHVTASTPPAFIVHTENDNTVPVQTSIDFMTAMHKAGADAELHLFDHGPHGFGTGGTTPQLAVWQDLLANWLRAHNLLTPPPNPVHM